MALKRPTNTNIFFGSQGSPADFRNELNTTYDNLEEVLNFTTSKIYKDGYAAYRNFSNNGAVLQTMNSQSFIDSYRTAYLYQNGIPAFDKTQDYFSGSIFMIGTVPHVVIGSDLSYTTKVDFSTTPNLNDPNGTTEKSDKYTQTLGAGFEDFRSKAVPLHLYQEGLGKPVVIGLDLVAKYPVFFGNSDGLVVADGVNGYNTARKEFIDNYLSFLKSGTDYKSFNVPQGFGLVNNHNGMGLTTGGGDGAGISAVDNHLINHVGQFTPITFLDSFDNAGDVPAVGQDRQLEIFSEQVTERGIGGSCGKKYSNSSADPSNYSAVLMITAAGGQFHITVTYPDISNFRAFPMEARVEGGGAINKAWFDLHPNTGAGLQLGYYTLLKQL